MTLGGNPPAKPGSAVVPPALSNVRFTIADFNAVPAHSRGRKRQSTSGRDARAPSPLAKTMRLGVVSDTHGYFDPCLREMLAGVDAILHGGDVGSPEILDELRQIAPVHAVRGNVDSPELNLPLSLTLNLTWLQVEIVHILSVPQSDLGKWAGLASRKGKPPQRRERFLKTFSESTGAVVFGHSHAPCLVNLGGILFFNPGSAGKKRFSLPRTCGLLEIFPDHLQATIKPLERYNGKLPERIRLEFDE